MSNITTTQQQKLKESYKRGIVQELYAKELLTEQQYMKLVNR